ncbi:MAG TPA: Na+/H+ antiporter subunit C [Kosmotogaceae bacterium]|nr:MAG: NADH-ubiquinone oxidoreductase chain 4L [Thermotogales bacterium 46_20]HAA85670.1 Na+/H+ antiporter subunit C [Kosmotogaceae bacterium]
MISEVVSYVSFFAVAVGIYGVITSRNLIRKIISLGICETGTTLLFVGVSAATGTFAPVVPANSMATLAFSDPVPQAVIITGIVINFSILCLLLVFTIMLMNRYHTVDAKTIERIVDKEE